MKIELSSSRLKWRCRTRSVKSNRKKIFHLYSFLKFKNFNNTPVHNSWYNCIDLVSILHSSFTHHVISKISSRFFSRFSSFYSLLVSNPFYYKFLSINNEWLPIHFITGNQSFYRLLSADETVEIYTVKN